MPELSPLQLALLSGGVLAILEIFLLPLLSHHPRVGVFHRGGLATGLIGAYVAYEILGRTVGAPTPLMFVLAGLAGGHLGVSYQRSKTARNPEIIRVHVNRIDALDDAAKRKGEPPWAEPYIARPVKGGTVIWNFTMKTSGNVPVPPGVNLETDPLYATVHYNGRKSLIGIPLPGTRFSPLGDGVVRRLQPFGPVEQVQDPNATNPATISVRRATIRLHPVAKSGSGLYSLEVTDAAGNVIVGMDPGMDIPKG